ncbi:MAG TPA: hypothetical protein DCM45_02005 [Clostridiales bacterium]|nr:hypothetical protein [Clostridiales bacterium]
MKRKLMFRSLILIVALLMFSSALAGCAGTTGKSATIKVGSQGYAEVEILAEIFKAVVEAKTDHKVEHVRNLGSSMAGFEATKSNDLQVFTSFTGTLYLGLLEQVLSENNRDPRVVFEETRDMMDQQYKMYCAEPWGYNNTYGIAVSRSWAEENNVKTQSDMAAFAPDMKLAVDQTWLNYPGQGYNEYVALYGFSYKEAIPMDLGLIYQAYANGDVDAVNCYTTDGQLVAMDMVVLEDDKNFNPPYNGILVLRNDIVEKYPEIKTIVDSFAGLIDTPQMQELNRQVSVDKLDPAAVAKAFLEEKGLLG